MINVKDDNNRFHDVEHIILNNKAFSYVYQGTKLIWSAVSKIWKGRDKWKNNDIWKY